MKKSLIYITLFLFVIMLGVLIAMAAGQGGVSVRGLTVFAMCTILAFSLQWIMFMPAYKFQTERYYDLSGSVTYLSVIYLALTQLVQLDVRAIILASLVSIWAIRLGTFLFSRILQDGSDSRFDEIKPVLLRFLNAWTLQGLWVIVTAGCALAAITSERHVPFGILGFCGIALWLMGFSIEVIADNQKKRFRENKQNKHAFISNGLWAYSRHPNYFGEILVWIGIAMIAYPALSGWQHVTLVSPLFVILLLTKVSGIPMLEEKADKRWADDQDYQAYKATTPVLIPTMKKPV